MTLNELKKIIDNIATHTRDFSRELVATYVDNSININH